MIASYPEFKRLRLSSSTCGQCELIGPCALASSKKLIVFSCHLECGIKRSISQGAGFDAYIISLITAFCGLSFLLAIKITSKLSNFILHQFGGFTNFRILPEAMTVRSRKRSWIASSMMRTKLASSQRPRRITDPCVKYMA